MLAGLVKGVDGEVFNVVDDDLPSSRQFLRLYKKSAKHFKSIYVPHVGQLCALLFVGEVFEMVVWTIAAGLQSEAMARGMEEDALQQ